MSATAPHDTAPLHHLLEAIVAHGGKGDYWPVARLREAHVSTYVGGLNDVEARGLLKALTCRHDVFLARKFLFVTPMLKGGGHLVDAFWALVLPWRGWGEEDGLNALKALRLNPVVQYHNARNVMRLIRALDRADVRFQPGADSDLEFLHLSNGAEASLFQQRVHRLFRRPYFPTLNSEHAFYSDPDFRTFCSDTLMRLSRHAAHYGDPADLHPYMGLKHILRRAIDHYWLAARENDYRRWEAAFGHLRWVEFLPPAQADRFDPHLTAHLKTATASSPNRSWMKQATKLIGVNVHPVRQAILELLTAWGSAPEVAESERLWLAGAHAYAHMHRLYRRCEPADVAKDLTVMELVDLPWIASDGTIDMPSDTMTNPICPSEPNKLLLKGTMWIARLWLDDSKIVEGIATAIAAASAPIQKGRSKESRALAVATAGINTLSTVSARRQLEALSIESADPRVRKAALKAINAGRAS